MNNLKINRKLTALLLTGTVLLVGCNVKKNNNVVFTKAIQDETVVFAEEIQEEETFNLITKDELNIRSYKSTESEIIDTVEEGTELEGVELDGDWYRILYDGETAYVKAEYVYKKVDKEGIDRETFNTLKDGLEIETKNYVEATDNVNIRSDASTDSNILSQLYEGNCLEITRLLNNGWYEVKYNDGLAYVNADYVKEITKDTIVSPMKKIVMFDHESNIHYGDNTKTVPEYEVAYIYGETEDMYIGTVNDSIYYINKEDTTTLEDKVVIVDISDQNAKLYDHNKVIVDTPVVTGGPDTPSDLGYFSIYSIEPDRTLSGPGYSVFTDITMFYNGGEALHDAEYHTDYDSEGNTIISHGWRSYDEFGGDTYQYNGSHGCVNLPNEAAMNIYHNVEVGTKVLVKK